MKKTNIIIMVAFIMMAVSCHAVITEQLLHYYSFEDTENDDIGANDGTATGVTFLPGFIGTSAYFDGVDDVITFGNIALPDPFTVSAWVNFTADSNNAVIGFGTSSTGIANIVLSYHSGHDTMFHYYNVGGVGEHYKVTSQTVSLNAWHHVVWKFGSSPTHPYKPEIWIDGVNQTLAIETDDGDPAYPSTYPYKMGYAYTALGYAHQWLDEVGIWNRTLSSAEISYLYNGGAGVSLAIAPAVSINTPENNTATNRPVTVNFSVTDITDPICFMSVNGTSTESISVTGATGVFELNSSNWLQGDNHVVINCTGSDYSATDDVYVYIDSNNPLYDHVGIIQDDGDAFLINGSDIDDSFTFNISLSNTYLFRFNISVCHIVNGTPDLSDCEYADEVNDINQSVYTYSEHVNIGTFQDEGSHAFVMEVCDSHTGRAIPDMAVVKSAQAVTIGGTDYRVSAGSIDTVKKSDRYEFLTSGNDKPFTIDVISPDPIFIVSKTDYAGHLVHGDRWTDFESDDAGVVAIRRVSANYVKVDISPGKDTARFTSTGLLNCVNRTDIAFINGEGINFTSVSPIGENFTVNGTGYQLEINYTPLTIEEIDNCTLTVGAVSSINHTVTPDTVNSFDVAIPAPTAGTVQDYTYSITCSQFHNHPPQYSHTVLSTSEDYGFSIENIATPEPPGEPDENVAFESIENSLWMMFLMAFWVVFYYFTFTLRGVNGGSVGFMNVMQMLFGFVAGSQLFAYSYILGIGIIFVSLGTFVGVNMYRK